MTVVDPGPTPANFRDVGGLPTAEGDVLPRGVLYRAEAPQTGDHAPTTATVWPPRTILDLRAEQEFSGAHPLNDVAAMHRLPMDVMLAPDALSREQVDELDLVARYRLLLGSADHQIARLVEIVAEAETPILVHCVAGKDRTGIVIALLLRLVGVDRTAVLDDYTRTNDNLPGLLARMRRAGVRLPEDPSLLAVSPEALGGILEHVEGDSGSPSGWLQAKGADPAKLELLHKRLTSS